MIYLYSGSGAGGFDLEDIRVSSAELSGLLKNTKVLLQANYGKKVCKLLDKFSFEIFSGTNYFNDDFFVLYAKISIQEYAKLKKTEFGKKHKTEFAAIARTITELGPFIRHIAIDYTIEPDIPLVKQPSLEITSSIVQQALEDARNLIQTSGATSAVDRVHTAFHGYLQAICKTNIITYERGDSVIDLFKAIKENHPKIKKDLSDPNINKIFRSMSAIIDSINQLRNNASVAHPNENLLPKAEAVFTINAITTLLHYLDEKLKKTPNKSLHTDQICRLKSGGKSGR